MGAVLGAMPVVVQLMVSGRVGSEDHIAVSWKRVCIYGGMGMGFGNESKWV